MRPVEGLCWQRPPWPSDSWPPTWTRCPRGSNRNEAAYEAASANGSAPDSEADALAGSAKLDVEPITERELEVLLPRGGGLLQ